MESITLERRDAAAKAKQLRRAGIVPCVVCGGSLPAPLHAQARLEDVRRLLKRSREGSVAELVWEGQRITALLRTVERSPASGAVIHMSFQALESGRRVSSKAQLVLLNRDVIGGIPQQNLYEIAYTALPEDLFDRVTVDLTDYPVGTSLTVGEIPEFASEKISLITEAGLVAVKLCDRKRGGGIYTAQ